MSRRVSHLIAGWRTGLPRPVLILQAGNALNYFGYGLILPFEIIYLHQIRGFSTSIAGLVLAATQGTPQSPPRRRGRCSTGTPPKRSWSQEAWRAPSATPASPTYTIPGRPLPARLSAEPESARQIRPTAH